MRYNKALGEIDLFVNGVKVSTHLGMGNDFPTSSQDVVSFSMGGGSANRATALLTGMMDEWSAYSRLLSDAEILTQASAGPNGRCIDYGNQPPIVNAGPHRCLDRRQSECATYWHRSR